MSIEEIVLKSDITQFRKRVYLELLKVPMGSTISYGELARRVSCKSAQAVGQALKCNPFAVGQDYTSGGSEFRFTLDFCVPCHRVIATDGTIGGFHGKREGAQIERKKQLLEQERQRKASTLFSAAHLPIPLP